MIDWARLEEVRERRRKSALETLLSDRRAADAQAAALHAARQAHAAAQDAKASHWRTAGADPALSAGALAGAAAWSRVLDERIAREDAVVAEAHACAQARTRAAEASREALRRAAGGVEKAARLAQQERVQCRRREDASLESNAEDLAAARWAARRSGRD